MKVLRYSLIVGLMGSVVALGSGCNDGNTTPATTPPPLPAGTPTTPPPSSKPEPVKPAPKTGQSPADPQYPA